MLMRGFRKRTMSRLCNSKTMENGLAEQVGSRVPRRRVYHHPLRLAIGLFPDQSDYESQLKSSNNLGLIVFGEKTSHKQMRNWETLFGHVVGLTMQSSQAWQGFKSLFEQLALLSIAFPEQTRLEVISKTTCFQRSRVKGMNSTDFDDWADNIATAWTILDRQFSGKSWPRQ